MLPCYWLASNIATVSLRHVLFYGLSSLAFLPPGRPRRWAATWVASLLAKQGPCGRSRILARRKAGWRQVKCSRSMAHGCHFSMHASPRFEGATHASRRASGYILRASTRMRLKAQHMPPPRIFMPKALAFHAVRARASASEITVRGQSRPMPFQRQVKIS